jgi:hypothetical protein
MLTSRENKTIADIVSGGMRKRKMLAVIFAITLFLANLTGSFYMKHEISRTLGASFQRSGSALMGLQAKTPKEASLKSMLISSDKDLRELMATVTFADINWRMLFLSMILFMFVISIWSCGHLERIIKKLEEERQGKAD